MAKAMMNASAEAKIGRWLRDQYLDWQKEIGEIRTIKEFAAFLDIPYPSFHKYFTGKRVPKERKTLEKLAVLGDDVYIITAREMLPDDALELLEMFFRLDDAGRRQLLAYAGELSKGDISDG